MSSYFLGLLVGVATGSLLGAADGQLDGFLVEGW